MDLPATGLVIGKFWPPHNGHMFLLDFASQHCQTLHIIIGERHDRVEQPSGADRTTWLAKAYPKAHVQLVEDKYDQDDSALWAGLCKGWLGFVPSIVFTSESYGDAFCRFLGSRHVLVDKERRNVPISATRVRQCPLASWEYLPPCTRGFYAARIVILGAESTGKTVLAGRLAEHFGTLWVPEVGREVTVDKLAADEYVWTSEDFTQIGLAQSAREDEMAIKCNRVLICDTDAFATTIWHQRYVPDEPTPKGLVDHVCERPKPDLYLIPELRGKPFVQDGSRDGENVREWMDETFRKTMDEQGRKYAVLEGGWETEFEMAVEIVKEVLRKKGWDWTNNRVVL